MVNSLTRNFPNRYAVGLFSLVILANLLVYFPSFFDSARGTDHQIFLAKIAHYETLPRLMAESYSYNRAPDLNGDTLLFIPIIFMLLAFEKWLFGYDFFWWQLTGFILHLIAQWCFWRVLNVFIFLRWSIFIVLLSSLLFLQQEIIVRHHLNGYLLFQIFALTAIYKFFQYKQDPTKNRKKFLWALILLTFACFTYEAGLVINGLMVILMYAPNKLASASYPKRDKIMVLAPGFFYLTVSALDFLWRVKNFSYTKNGLTGSLQIGSFNPLVLWDNFLNVLKIGFEGFFFPALTKIKFISDQYHYDSFSWKMTPLATINLALIILLIIFIVYCTFYAIKKKADIKSFANPTFRTLGLFFLLLTGIYIGLLCLLRLQTNTSYLRTVPHHFYFLYSFFILGIFYLLLPFFLFIDRHDQTIKQGLIIFLISFSLIHGYYLYQLNNKFRVLWEPQRILLLRMDHFVNQHKGELDFTFTMVDSELTYKHIVNSKSGHMEMKSILEMFYPQFAMSSNPKYYLIYTKTGGVESFTSLGEALIRVEKISQNKTSPKKEIYIGGRKYDLRMLSSALSN